MFFNRVIKPNQYGFEYGDNLKNLSRSGMYFPTAIKSFMKDHSHFDEAYRLRLATILVLNVISKIEAFLEKNPHLDSFDKLNTTKVTLFHDSVIAFADLVEGFALDVIHTVKKQRIEHDEDKNSYHSSPRM